VTIYIYNIRIWGTDLAHMPVTPIASKPRASLSDLSLNSILFRHFNAMM